MREPVDPSLFRGLAFALAIELAALGLAFGTWRCVEAWRAWQPTSTPPTWAGALREKAAERGAAR